MIPTLPACASESKWVELGRKKASLADPVVEGDSECECCPSALPALGFWWQITEGLGGSPLSQPFIFCSALCWLPHCGFAPFLGYFTGLCAPTAEWVAGDIVGYWLNKVYNKQVNSSCHVQTGLVRSQQRLPSFNSDDVKGSWLLWSLFARAVTMSIRRSSPPPEQLVILRERRTGTQPVGDLRAGECRVWQLSQSLLLAWDPRYTGLWCAAEPAGNLGVCLDNRQGRKMCRSGAVLCKTCAHHHSSITDCSGAELLC